MSLPVDPLEKARLREATRKLEREHAETRENNARARIRKLEAEYAFRRAVVIGTTIRDKWDQLSPETRQEISQYLAAAGLSDSDKIKLAAYLPVAAPQSEDLGDYAPERPYGDGLDQVPAEAAK